MKRTSIILLMLLQTIVCCGIFAQSKRGNQWMTGRGTTVMFANNVITTKYIAVTPWHYFTGSNSNISDTNGNLILCSDEFNIFDSVGNYIDEGDTLVANNGHSVSAVCVAFQSVEIIHQTEIF